MSPGTDVFHDDAFEVTAGNAAVINKNIIAMLGEVLENRQHPGNVGATIADKNRSLEMWH
jgi:hypothetical protein